MAFPQYNIRTIKELYDLVNKQNVETLSADLVLALYTHVELKEIEPLILSPSELVWINDGVVGSTAKLNITPQEELNGRYQIVITPGQGPG